ncbi:hypothetical protein H0E87_028785, partial [Populus deltoides]
MAPEIYNDEIFDRSVDAYSFGVILYEMLEGVQPFHPKTPEEAVKLMCLEKKRPPFKIKNLLSDQPFLRSSQDWIEFVATVQNKDGGKTLLSFHDVYMALEIYNDEIFDRSVDGYSFGVILYEMLEGLQPFHPKTPEEAVKLMCLEKKRPPFKIK